MIGYIGIDLGQKGAISVQSYLAGDPKPYWQIFPFYARHFDETRQRSLTEFEIYTLLKTIISKTGDCFIAIEHPVFMPTNGKKAISVLHENFGLMKGILIGLGIESFWFPKPIQWKKVVSAKGSDKDKMLVLASRVTKAPNLSPITADSVLISEACRLHFRS